jgi:hypothetical protein
MNQAGFSSDGTGSSTRVYQDFKRSSLVEEQALFGLNPLRVLYHTKNRILISRYMVLGSTNLSVVLKIK